MTKELQAHVAATPNIKTVYFNDKGQWQFIKNKHYTAKEMSRDEVLAAKATAATAEETRTSPVTVTTTENSADLADMTKALASHKSENADLLARIDKLEKAATAAKKPEPAKVAEKGKAADEDKAKTEVKTENQK